MPDMIVARHETRNLDGRGQVNLMYFHQGQVLLVGSDAVGLYRDEDALTDPFGNGTLGYEPIPPHLRPGWEEGSGFIREQQAGFVGLTSGAVLFIRPDGVALYQDGSAALRNLQAFWLIPFDAA